MVRRWWQGRRTCRARRRVATVLALAGGLTAAQVADRCGLPVGRVAAALLAMEVDGVVMSHRRGTGRVWVHTATVGPAVVRPSGWGCSRIAHAEIGWCAHCPGLDGAAEMMAWRLRAAGRSWPTPADAARMVAASPDPHDLDWQGPRTDPGSGPGGSDAGGGRVCARCGHRCADVAHRCDGVTEHRGGWVCRNRAECVRSRRLRHHRQQERRRAGERR